MLLCVQRVHASLEEGAQADGVGVSWTGPSEEEPAYRLLVDCNQLAVRRRVLTGSDAYDIDLQVCIGRRKLSVWTLRCPSPDSHPVSVIACLYSAAVSISAFHIVALLRLIRLRCEDGRLQNTCIISSR